MEQYLVADTEFREEVIEAPYSKDLSICQQCGKCTPFCPITRVSDEFSPRRLIRFVQMGQRDDPVLGKKVVWLCANCYHCTEMCTHQIEPAEIITTLKNRLSRAKQIPPGRRMMYKKLAETGLCFDVGEKENQEREDMGLARFPEVDIGEIHKILEGTEVLELMTKRK